MKPMSDEQRAKRFWSRVRKTDGCWEWTGSSIWTGYGNLRGPGGENIYAHVYAFGLTCGPVPKGLYVLHSCDNRLCCRPDHLFAGTQQDNVDDMVAKGRHPRGETNGRSKLTEDEVRTVLFLVGAGYPKERIAEWFGVTAPQIRGIATGLYWSHLSHDS